MRESMLLAGGTLVVETVGRIRPEHFVKGKSIKQLVRELKVSRNTVRKVLRSGAICFEYARVNPNRKPALHHIARDRGRRPIPVGRPGGGQRRGRIDRRLV